jgi:hypothetical protein
MGDEHPISTICNALAKRQGALTEKITLFIEYRSRIFRTLSTGRSQNEGK